MALQDSSRLVMIGLGIALDAPPLNSPQPALVDGVHLFWNPGGTLGLPWYGFYLFRRPHQSGTLTCISGGLAGFPLGSLATTLIHVGSVDVSSDSPLVLTDEFPPTPTREIDLANRQFLQASLVGLALLRRAELKIGFRDVANPPVGPVTVDFSNRPTQWLENPHFEQGATFTAQVAGALAANNAIVIAQTNAGAVAGLDCQNELDIDLPRTSSFAELVVTAAITPVSVEAYDGEDLLLGRVTLNTAQHQTTVRFTRGSPNRLVVRAVGGGAVLHRVSYERVVDPPTVQITALLAGVEVLKVTADGDPGQVVPIVLRFDAFDTVKIGTAAGVLVDFCYVTVADGATSGWSLCPGAPNLIRLPVTHPSYSAGAAPIDESAAEVLALSRVRYGPASNWASPAFLSLHDDFLVPLVQGGPAGPAMSTITSTEVGVGDPPGSDRMPSMVLPLLDLLLLSSLHPAVAQMLGLYWADQTAQASSAQSYDYLVVADHSGIGGLSPTTTIAQIQSAGFASLDGWISFDLRPGPAAVVPPPQDLRVYSLPGATRESLGGGETNAVCNAGLTWEIERSNGALVPGAPIFFHVWRASLGSTTPASPPSMASYSILTIDRPVLLTRPTVAGTPRRSAAWPPFDLLFIDPALAEGWYAYEINAVDIFGRFSANGVPAVWYQWSPAPDPDPWYQLPGQGTAIVHPYAVRLLDKIAPPAPTAVEATALDPADPLFLRDTAYTAWIASLQGTEPSTVIGLRVSWKWTPQHQTQAPDTAEFRIYYQPGRLNAPTARIVSATPVDANTTDVQTDLVTTAGTGAYVGGALRVGPKAFPIVASSGSPLLLRVDNVGPTQSDRPAAPSACTVAISRIVSLGTISATQSSTQMVGSGTSWNAALVGQRLLVAGDLTNYTVAAVTSATTLTIDRPYEGTSVAGRAYGIDSPLYVDYAKSAAWQERYYVVPYGSSFVTETDGTRSYDVLLPASADTDRNGLELPGRLFVPSAVEPIVYSHVGVSAADDKTHTLDDPRWASGPHGNRTGNEGRVSAPAMIFRVLRTPPGPPPIGSDSQRRYASPADYHSHSFFTYRWFPGTNLKTHVSRALDETLFRTDLGQRPRPALDTSATSPFFPSANVDPRWDAAKRTQVGGELDSLNAHSGTYPQAAVFYRALSDDARRILAGLPGNEAAFSQLTIQPLDPIDPANADRIGPDDTTYTPSPTLRAYVDTLDGRASNSYFYRSRYVDGAGNRGPLGLSSPPVYLPKVVPPRTPVVTRALGGDRAISIFWAFNRESDLASYRIYRADSLESTRDLRLMTKVFDALTATPVPSGDPPGLTWDDTAPPYFVDRYYVMTAVDATGNESSPSPVVLARAYDDSRPAPPTWNPPTPVSSPGGGPLGPPGGGIGGGGLGGGGEGGEGGGPDDTPTGIVLSWTSPDPGLTCLVERSPQSADTWAGISRWIRRGLYTYTDLNRDMGALYDYRLRVLDRDGRQNDTFEVLAGQ